MADTGDPYDLERFVRAQDGVYEQALAEIWAGRKRSHWMWFVFPQVEGLGRSEMARAYAIAGLAEAEAYLAHPVLGPRLLECAEAVMAVEDRTADEIFGHPDDQKLRSCATLFMAVSPFGSVFDRLIAEYFGAHLTTRRSASSADAGRRGSRCEELRGHLTNLYTGVATKLN